MVIGDLIASKKAVRRNALQRRFQAALDTCNDDKDNRRAILSPYTITIGDEFQVVFSDPSTVFRDILRIQADLLPDKMRFSLAIGTLSTSVNRKRAVGMDGPAFHRARAGIDSLKDEQHSYVIGGLGGTLDALANSTLTLISDQMEKWRTVRFQVLAMQLRGEEPSAIAETLGISKTAVYKNREHGSLLTIQRAFDALARLAADHMREAK